VPVPADVTVDIDGNRVRVTGPRGELERTFRPEVAVRLDAGILHVEVVSPGPQVPALHGLSRALLANMVSGVHQGFEKTLEVEGVGYRAEMDGKVLVLHVGYSHPVRRTPPEGIAFDVDTKTRTIRVTGADKELVGQVAAEVRKVRPPEPYKGKGIRYRGEYVRRKAGKAGKVA
jgi:large subunit ribosomal protein L6